MNTFRFTHEGREFLAIVEPDPGCDAPWDNSDGHGPVRVVRHRLDGAKRPGERVLYSTRGTIWLYDWQKACKLARREKWNAQPYDAPNRIERAVTADFEFLRGYLTGEWHYVGVCVIPAGGSWDDRYAHAVWGIESNAGDYLQEVAAQLAGEIE